MWFDEKYKSGIMLENVSMLFLEDERKQFEEKLNEQNIGVLFLEKRSIQNSIFQAISIYINENLTGLFIAGLLAPATYDAIKTAFLYVIKKIKTWILKTKKETPVACLHFKTGEAEIIAPIPNDLTDEQFKMYMDMLRESLSDANESKLKKTTRYECFIAECDDRFESIHIKTINEYGNEQIVKQRKRQMDNDEVPPMK